MNDIAAEAGVARSTVSRILNDVSTAVPVAPATRARVLETARVLGYRPNPMARALRGAPTMLLGVIVRDVADPFFGGAIEMLSSAARERGYNLVLGNARAEVTEALALAAVLESRQCDALLLIGDLRDQPSLIDELRFGQEPVVALWQGEELAGIPAIDVDNRYGVTTAMKHLRDLGHRRIAFIGGGSLGDIRERRAAFVGGRAPGDLLLDGYVRDVANTPGDGVAAIHALMRLGEPPTAVIVSTDFVAIGVLHGAGRLGLRVPGDLSIVGFDDIRVAEFAVPALTTLRMPTRPMVDAALDIALRSIPEPAAGWAAERRVFRPELIVRETTGAAPA